MRLLYIEKFPEDTNVAEPLKHEYKQQTISTLFITFIDEYKYHELQAEMYSIK